MAQFDLDCGFSVLTTEMKTKWTIEAHTLDTMICQSSEGMPRSVWQLTYLA